MWNIPELPSQKNLTLNLRSSFYYLGVAREITSFLWATNSSALFMCILNLQHIALQIVYIVDTQILGY